MASKSAAVDPDTNTRRTRRIREIRSACSSKCGSAAGWSGPAIFMLKGKKAPVGLDQAYLERHGGAPGGDVQPHDPQNAYMSKSKEAWEGGGVGSPSER
jgi:hypothetical protein